MYCSTTCCLRHIKKFILLLFAISFPNFVTAQTDIEKVRTNLINHPYYASQYPARPASPATADLLASIQSDGSFNGATPTLAHLSTNIFKLAYVLKDTGSAYYNDPLVKQKSIVHSTTG